MECQFLYPIKDITGIMIQKCDSTGIVCPTHIDIFAGCGGVSLGLHNAGWKGLFAIEKSDMAFETLNHNLISKKKHFDWPEWIPTSEHDIYEILKNYTEELKGLKGKVDLVAGGPPCQGFSFAGRRNKEDERNKLVDCYIEFIDLIKPKMVFFENVKGFTIGFKNGEERDEAYSTYVVKKLEGIGYKVHSELIDFSEYGVPQKRERFILIGSLDSDPMVFFEKLKERKSSFLKEKGLKKQITIKDAISDLEQKHGYATCPDTKSFNSGVYGNTENKYQKMLRKGIRRNIPDSHRFPKHKTNTINKFRYILDNCTRGKNVNQETKQKFNLNKHCVTLLDPDKPCPTLTTLPDDYIHYSEPRILTVREYARIQSFSDWYEFKGNYTTGGERRKKDVPRYTQIGNAVPPLFVELAGTVLKEMI